MQTIATPRTRWIGRWVMTVAALHAVVGVCLLYFL
jgi:hypothetical protein